MVSRTHARSQSARGKRELRALKQEAAQREIELTMALTSRTWKREVTEKTELLSAFPLTTLKRRWSAQALQRDQARASWYVWELGAIAGRH